MSCHVMASRAMPGHIFACHAIFLRVMPCHNGMPCQDFLGKICLEEYFQEFGPRIFMGAKYFQEFGQK